MKEKDKYDLIYSQINSYASSHKPKIDYVSNWAGSGNSIVDLGCGRGMYIRSILESNDVVGVELSTVCCEKYLQDLKHYNESIIDFCNKYDTKFDKAYSCDVLEHIPPEELIPLLEAIKRVSDDFLFLVCTGSDIKNNIELHLSNHSYEEWEKILGSHFNINKGIKGFSQWPYIHIFECSN